MLKNQRDLKEKNIPYTNKGEASRSFGQRAKWEGDRGSGLGSINGCVGFHNIVSVRGGADADSEVEREGVHGATVWGRLGGWVEAPNLRGHHRVAEAAEASLPQSPWIQTRRWLRLALSTPAQGLPQDDHDWVLQSLFVCVLFVFLLIWFVYSILLLLINFKSKFCWYWTKIENRKVFDNGFLLLALFTHTHG